MARFIREIQYLAIFQLGILLALITRGGCSLVASPYENGESKEIHLVAREISCPEAEDISPCVCLYDEESLSLDMDCSDVKSEKELRGVFSQKFPFTNFRKLILHKNKNIRLLREGDLGNVSFTEMRLTSGVLTVIGELALMGSWQTLTLLMLKGNHLRHVPDISNFTRLSELRLDVNKLTQFPVLKSKTLRHLHLPLNNIKRMPFDALHSLPSLTHFGFLANPLTEIESGTFANNEELSFLNLGMCELTTIPKDAIRLHGQDTQLMLYDNHLTFLPYEAVSGVTSKLEVSANNLTELPEEVYRPLLEKDVWVSVDENPFVCGCDMAWLIENPTLLMKLPYVDYEGGFAPSCYNGQRFIDLDPQYYREKCHDTTHRF